MTTARRLCAPILLLCLTAATSAWAQPAPTEYRAVWIDTFNTRLASSDDVRVAVSRAAALHANVLLVQVRRRGDAWYLDSDVPTAEGVPAGFDPLAEVLAQARPLGLQVHVVLTLGAIWNQTDAPLAPQHVFNRHGLGSGRAPEGSANWLTRTLAPDGSGTSFDGYRFGNDFWLDPGHPGVADYLTGLLVRLVQRYPVDGVHLDRLQYPEVAGTSGALSMSVGYNPTAVARYNARYGTSGLPAADDGRFAAWRREQVTNLVERMTVSLLAVRPSLVVSAAATAAGAPPGQFQATEPYQRAFQDWQAWLERGSVDLVVPQVFRAAHLPAAADEFGGWTRWAQASQARRAVVVGLGAYLNAVEGTVHQVRVVRAAANRPGDEGGDATPLTGTPLAGVALFSLAANNAPVVSNPLSVPAGRDTPLRAIEDLAAGLRFGRTTTGQAVDTATSGPFADTVDVPTLPWKRRDGHLLGTLIDAAGQPVDGVALRAVTADGHTALDTTSDGSGVFALPALAPGTYRLAATSGEGTFTSDCSVEVEAAVVARVTLTLDATRPAVLACR